MNFKNIVKLANFYEFEKQKSQILNLWPDPKTEVPDLKSGGM